MDKRYQVFVSSTYEDLRQERQKVIQALLEFSCIPVGMEFFPAADDSQWEVIKRVIDDCDYYVVIVAGRYGSLSPEGISYTQKEYEYAVKKGVPVIAFLHGDPGKIAAEKSESSAESKRKLQEFRSLCEQKLCKHWHTTDELTGAVLTSLNQLIKARPMMGWVRADQVADEAATKEILQLHREVDSLRNQLTESKFAPPPASAGLAQGDDEVAIQYKTVNPGDGKTAKVGSIILTWNTIFSIIGPHALWPQSGGSILSFLLKYLEDRYEEQILADCGFKSVYALALMDEDKQTILIQLKALGLISLVGQSHIGTDDYLWKITTYGDAMLTQLRAIKRPKDQPVADEPKIP